MSENEQTHRLEEVRRLVNAALNSKDGWRNGLLIARRQIDAVLVATATPFNELNAEEEASRRG